MKRIPKANYQTVEQLQIQIEKREADAALIPAGPARQTMLIELAQLRSYYEVKRWLAEDAR